MNVTNGAAGTCASILKILADGTRLAVVQQLLTRPKYVGGINATLQLNRTPQDSYT